MARRACIPIIAISSRCCACGEPNPAASAAFPACPLCTIGCSKSGYALVTADGKFLKLDETGNAKALAALKATSKESDLKAKVSGSVDGEVQLRQVDAGLASPAPAVHVVGARVVDLDVLPFGDGDGEAQWISRGSAPPTDVVMVLYVSATAIASELHDCSLSLEIDVPWVADGLRDLGHRRQEMSNIFREALIESNIPFITVRGDFATREAAMVRAVDDLLARL